MIIEVCHIFFCMCQYIMKYLNYSIIKSCFQVKFFQYYNLNHHTTILMSEDKEMLRYYQQKIDELYKERLSWLSKFNQCNTHLQEKHHMMQQLQEHKDKEFAIQRNIIHHDIALIDENINVNKMERENIINQYNDAHQILKIQELLQQYPQAIQKHLPCNIFNNNNQIINNELNIHSRKSNNQGLNDQKSSIFRESNSVLSNSRFKQAKVKYKPSYQQLMKRQINEIKINQQKELVLLNEQAKKLEGLIKKVKKQDKNNLEAQRSIVEELKKQEKKQQQKYKDISQKFFMAKKQIKQDHQYTLKENSRLKTVLSNLETKVNQEMRIYEKENKAKQTLILRKSQDFQEDYKARMRAKERKLQALKENYQKMQEVCIQKIQKLQQTVVQARDKLRQTQSRRQYLLNEYRHELNGLEVQVKVQRTEKAQIDLQFKQKMEQNLRKRQLLHQKQEQEARRFKKTTMIQQAYRKPEKKISKGKSKQKKGHVQYKVPKQNESQSGQQDQLDMSDLQNLRKDINRLGNIIEPPRSKKNK